MLLTIKYSNTKRFLKRSIKSFKSYFSGGYERLPKTPPCNPFSCTNSTHFTLSYREPENIIMACPRESLKVMESGASKKNGPLKYKASPDSINQRTKNATSVKSMKHKEPKVIINVNQENKKLYHGNHEDEPSKCLVMRKLKELEMIDQSDVDLVLDVEEVLHYYSRLTCPVYRDIVEKFLVEMYLGTFDLSRVENVVSKKRLVKV